MAKPYENSLKATPEWLRQIDKVLREPGRQENIRLVQEAIPELPRLVKPRKKKGRK